MNGRRWEDDLDCTDLIPLLIDGLTAAQVEELYRGIAPDTEACNVIYRIADQQARQHREAAPFLSPFLNEALELSAAACLRDTLGKLGRPCADPVAREAAYDLLSLPLVDRTLATRGVAGCMRRPCNSGERLALIAGQAGQLSHEVCAYCDFRDPLSSEEALGLLQSPSAELCLLGENPERRYFLAKVDPGKKRFTAAWLRLNIRDQVILIHRNTRGKLLVEHVFHELGHIAEDWLRSCEGREQS